MYSRQQAAQLRQEFWTAFGRYMSPVLSAEGEHINWMNYKTAEKDIYFRMNADNKKAAIAIELTQKDTGLQALYFEQFVQLKIMLQNIIKEEWIWLAQIQIEPGKIISRIYTEQSSINIFDKNDWPQLISFFKPRIIALDAFWSQAKYAFEMLR